MKELKIRNSTLFANELNNYYLKNNFGTFNKSELEELFVFLLMQYGNLNDMTNFERSIVLHLPESRVRALMYRAQLKYETYSEHRIRADFFNLLKKGRYEVIDTGKDSKNNPIRTIYITIEQQYLQEAIQAKLKEAGKAVKGNIYKETLEISENALLALFPYFFTPDETKEIKQIYEKQNKKKFGEILGNISSFLSKEGAKVGLQKIGDIIVENVDTAIMIAKLSALIFGAPPV